MKVMNCILVAILLFIVSSSSFASLVGGPSEAGHAPGSAGSFSASAENRVVTAFSYLDVNNGWRLKLPWKFYSWNPKPY